MSETATGTPLLVQVRSARRSAGVTHLDDHRWNEADAALKPLVQPLYGRRDVVD